jgi:hypothetical protein
VAEKPKEDDGFRFAVAVFAFYAFCMGFSGWLLWYGTGKLPWQ